MNMKLIDQIKALKKRDKYVLSAIVNLTWYCVAVLVLSSLGKTVPDSLTVAWFSAGVPMSTTVPGLPVCSR